LWPWPAYESIEEIARESFIPVAGYRKANSSAMLKLFLSRLDDVIASVTRRVRKPN